MRNRTRTGASRQKNVLRLVRCFFAVFAFHDHFRCSPAFCNATFTFNNGDLILLHQVLHAARELTCNLTRAFNHRIKIEADIVCFQPVSRSILHLVIHFSRAEQSFGRNTAPVETNASQGIPFDDGRLKT